jgi:NAD(P)-dependent dehydrogenase (short-subunit alcohol dehydrogenase family)
MDYPHHPDMELNLVTKSERPPPPSRHWRFQQFKNGLNNDHLTIPDADLRGKWVIVTNATDPIAREAAIQFASWGANVMLTGSREMGKNDKYRRNIFTDCITAAKVAGHTSSIIDWEECDCTSISSVESFAFGWALNERPLDILVNNFWNYVPADHVIDTEDGIQLYQVSEKAPRWLALT